MYDLLTMGAAPDKVTMFACQRELLALLETLTDVIFCAKDVDGFYVDVNAAFVRRTGRRSKREVIGTRASDHFGEYLAERYAEQDRAVFEKREPLRDQLELIRRTNGQLGWYLTTKIPVDDPQEPAKMVGLVSVSRDLLTPSEETVVIEGLQHVVDFVRKNIGGKFTSADLAAVAGCSTSQLSRRMRRVFGVTATQYLLRVRVDAAAALLTDPTVSLVDVAARCGFYDQPDFTRRFARLTNATPAQFRADRSISGAKSGVHNDY